MEVSLSSEMELADSEFDLDVKLEPVARHLSEERAKGNGMQLCPVRHQRPDLHVCG